MLSIRTAKNVQKLVQDYFSNIVEFPRDALIWGRRYVWSRGGYRCGCSSSWVASGRTGMDQRACVSTCRLTLPTVVPLSFHFAIRAFHELLAYFSRLAKSPVDKQRNFAASMISMSTVWKRARAKVRTQPPAPLAYIDLTFSFAGNVFYKEEFLEVFPRMITR